MAIDMYSESSSLTTSPRISFSHDLLHTDVVPIEPSSSLFSSNSDQFHFCISDTIKNEPSSADELFSDGLILPLQLQQKFVTSKHVPISNPLPPLPLPSPNQIPKHQSKPFWRIKRSSSLHCDNTYKKTSFWSLPILSRSNSTGSVPASKQTHKHNSQKQPKNSSFYAYPLSQKPPVKKNYGGSYGNGVWISPVLNVPPPFISKGTANLFGLGSFFGNGKDKKNKK